MMYINIHNLIHKAVDFLIFFCRKTAFPQFSGKVIHIINNFLGIT